MQSVPYFTSPDAWFEVLRNLDRPILLDGSVSERSRYDIMSAAPSVTITLYANRCVVLENGREQHFDPTQFFSLLKLYRRDRDSRLPFNGGLMGYIGYEIAAVLGQAPFHADTNDEDVIAEVSRYEWAIIQDHKEQKAYIVNPDHTPSTLAQPGVETKVCTFEPTLWRASTDRMSYRQNIAVIHEYIRSGDVYQVNYTQRFSATTKADGWDIYRCLRQKAKAPFCAYIPSIGRNKIISVSPERFVSLTKSDIVAQPIKGTSPRSAAKEVDIQLAKALSESIKDRSENLMIVDLLRNDVGKVAMVGTVEVPKLFELQSFTNVHHLVSTITAKIKPEFDAVDLLEATIPGGSITGAPKRRAMEIISELESTPRGPYCGTIFYIGDNGSFDSNISIRTLQKQGDEISIWGGGGIVIDSDADAEQAESRTKIRAFIQALNGTIEDD